MAQRPAAIARTVIGAAMARGGAEVTRLYTPPASEQPLSHDKPGFDQNNHDALAQAQRGQCRWLPVPGADLLVLP